MIDRGVRGCSVLLVGLLFPGGQKTMIALWLSLSADTSCLGIVSHCN